MPASPPIPTLVLYRSITCGHSWDQFEPHYNGTTGARCLPRACASNHSGSTITPEAHIVMGYHHHMASPYISFSYSLHWIANYHLLQEHFRKASCPKKSPRKLYAIQVVAENIDVPCLPRECERARAFAGVAHEMLGHGQVRVKRMVEVEIPRWLDGWSSSWFQSQLTYPYHAWLGAPLEQDDGKMCLDMVDGFVKLWELGVSEEALQIPLPANEQD